MYHNRLNGLCREQETRATTVHRCAATAESDSPQISAANSTFPRRSPQPRGSWTDNDCGHETRRKAVNNCHYLGLYVLKNDKFWASLLSTHWSGTSLKPKWRQNSPREMAAYREHVTLIPYLVTGWSYVVAYRSRDLWLVLRSQILAWKVSDWQNGVQFYKTSFTCR